MQAPCQTPVRIHKVESPQGILEVTQFLYRVPYWGFYFLDLPRGLGCRDLHAAEEWKYLTAVTGNCRSLCWFRTDKCQVDSCEKI